MTPNMQSQFAHVISAGELIQALDRAYGIVNPYKEMRQLSCS